jgi:hypothetical protein
MHFELLGTMAGRAAHVDFRILAEGPTISERGALMGE